jgi:hypothetical protein
MQEKAIASIEAETIQNAQAPMTPNMKKNLFWRPFAPARSKQLAALAAAFLALPCLLPAQILTHRYSLTNSLVDSVGGANGTFVNRGTDASFANGGLSLPGGSGNGYVSLPNGIVQGDTNVSVECWVQPTAINTWAEIWDFGSSGSLNFGLIQDSPGPGNMRVAFTPSGNELDIDAPTYLPETSNYVTVTYNNTNLTGDLYLNGALDGTRVFPSGTYSPGTFGGTSGTTEDMIGNDVFNDPQFGGTVYELRVWNGVLSPVYVAVAQYAGPTVVITNSTPESVAVLVTTNMIGAQTQQAAVTGNFAQISNAPVTVAATNWFSSNTNVVSVNTSGLITGLSGGTATVSATVGGVTGTSAPITVALTSPTISQQPAPVTIFEGESATFSVSALGGGLDYQWSFDSTAIPGATNSTLVLTNVNLDEAGSYAVLVSNTLGNAPSSTVSLTVNAPTLQHRYSFNTDANDSVGGANATLYGATYLANNAVQLPGGAASTSNYVQFPTGMLVGDNSMSIEIWLTDTAGVTWAEAFCFGGSTAGPNPGGQQTNYISLIPTSGNAPIDMRGAFKLTSEQDVDAPAGGTLPLNTEEYVVLTYDAPSTTGTLYLNGVVVGVNNNLTITPAQLGNTYNNYLGLDEFNDNLFQGSVDELRIWNAPVSPLYMAVQLASGPDTIATNLTPTSVSVTLTNTTLAGNQTEQATAVGNFAAASGITVTTAVTNWASSNPTVLTVNSTGLITALTAGSATVSATVNGVTGTSAPITVPATSPTITTQPESTAIIVVGGTLHASVTNLGVAPFTYKWYYNSNTQPIAGQTNGILVVTNVQMTNAGSYTAVVGNQYGGTTSAPVALTVIAPTIFEQDLLALQPLAYWPLNETTGSTAYDVIGGFNGTYEGGITLGQPGLTNAIYGTNSYSANFDGGTSYVDVPEGPFNITNAISVMGWINSQSAVTFEDIIGHGDLSWRITIDGSGGNPGANDGSLPSDASATNNILDGNWHLVVYTYNGTFTGFNGLLYVDGVLVGENAISSAPQGDDLDVWIGGAPDYGTYYTNPNLSRIFYGNIANTAVFTYALTPAEVEGLYSGQVNLTITHTGSNVTLTWPNGTLLEAPTVSGPWTTNSAAVSPYTVTATSGDQFFKVIQVNP